MFGKGKILDFTVSGVRKLLWLARRMVTDSEEIFWECIVTF